MSKTTELSKRIIQKDIEGMNQLLDYFEENDLIDDLIYYFVHSDLLDEIFDTKDLQVIYTCFNKIGFDIITDNDHTPLIWAASQGYTNIVKFLVASGADVNLETPNGNFALYAAMNNLSDSNWEIFEYLYPLTSEELQEEFFFSLFREEKQYCLLSKDGKRPITLDFSIPPIEPGNSSSTIWMRIYGFVDG
jgi:hypothetical protein